jgi:hypothetical protein
MYWFPRPVNATEAGDTRPPLIVLGGGRGIGGPGYEQGGTDDSVVNPVVSKVLREFLPSVYPEGWFQKGKKPEMEWVSRWLSVWNKVGPYVLTDGDHGIHNFWRSDGMSV